MAAPLATGEGKANNFAASGNTGMKLVTASSGYMGVHYNSRDDRWVSRVRASGKHVHVGTFRSEVEAAMRYDDKVRELKVSLPLNFSSKKKAAAALAASKLAASKGNSSSSKGNSNGKAAPGAKAVSAKAVAREKRGGREAKTGGAAAAAASSSSSSDGGGEEEGEAEYKVGDKVEIWYRDFDGGGGGGGGDDDMEDGQGEWYKGSVHQLLPVGLRVRYDCDGSFSRIPREDYGDLLRRRRQQPLLPTHALLQTARGDDEPKIGDRVLKYFRGFGRFEGTIVSMRLQQQQQRPQEEEQDEEEEEDEKTLLLLVLFLHASRPRAPLSLSLFIHRKKNTYI